MSTDAVLDAARALLDSRQPWTHETATSVFTLTVGLQEWLAFKHAVDTAERP